MTKRARFNYKIHEKNEIEYKTIMEYISKKLEPYMGKTQIEIYEDIYNKSLEKVPKNINKLISDKLLGKDKELNELFPEEKFIIKNLPLTENGTARERMSFKSLRISDFDTDWEDSFWKSYFEDTTFILICYAEKNNCRNGQRILKTSKFINFNDNEINSFKKTYNQIKKAIKLEDSTLLPTPSSFEGQLLEIGPKGQKGDDAYNNFFKKDKTKTAFMINKKCLNKKLKE